MFRENLSSEKNRENDGENNNKFFIDFVKLSDYRDSTRKYHA